MTALATEPLRPVTQRRPVPTVRRLAPYEPPLESVCDCADHDHSRSRLALVPPPDTVDELPFDDERPCAAIVPWPPGADRDAGFWDRQPTRARDLPDPVPWSHTLVHALLEVLAGQRAVTQIRPYLSPAVYSGVSSRVARRLRWPDPSGRSERRTPRVGRTVGGPEGKDADRGAAGESTRRGHGTLGVPPGRVRSVHVSAPADGVIEMTAVVRDGGRYRAVAARLEGLDGRWRCVQLQIG